MMSQDTAFQMLDLLTAPAFCVKNGTILRVNHAAEQLFLTPGMDIHPLITSAQEEYTACSGKTIYLTLFLSGSAYGATVTCMKDFDVFVLELGNATEQLQTLSLAARELRKPLSTIMTVADSLFPTVSQNADVHTQQQLAQLNRGCYQMLRIIGNMSDAAGCVNAPRFRPETRDICAVLEEILQHASGLCAQSGVQLQYQLPAQAIYCAVDRDLLQRAILNLISNSLKFVPANGCISCNAVQHGKQLHLTVADNGNGISPEIMRSIFSRYLRVPMAEDGRHGIGLGMLLVRAAAIAHGGTVFLEQPEGEGAKITMTLSLEQPDGTKLRSPMLKVDYAGERSHELIELSDCLKAECYDTSLLNG